MSTTYHMVHYRRFDADTKALKGKTLEVLCRGPQHRGKRIKAVVPPG